MKELQPHAPELKYRGDIDGLRAVAVLSVIAGHLDIARLSGGYVGVDVFFVISGYLISSIILTDIAEGQFSILAFYERRIRRIFPALFGMLCVMTIFAVIYLLPVELVNYCNSLLAATFSCSNFYFWRHSGYFDSPTSNPLLHTWSLAVEEQFYILFPIFLLVARRFVGQRLRSAVVVLCIASFALSIVVVASDKNTAFYMPYTRAWELLMGTILSLKLFPRIEAAWGRNVATICGGLLVALPVLFYTPATPFPGLAALAPCLGSALIIGAGESGSSMIGSLLSWRPVVFIGLISYSFYLWHWPVFVLYQMGVLFSMAHLQPARFAGILTVHRLDLIAEVTVSFVLAVLSWRFIERPFRSGALKLTGRTLFATAGAVMLLFGAFSLTGRLAGGFESRFPPQAVQLASYLNYEQVVNGPTRRGVCFITTSERFEDFNKELCLHQDPGKANYLLMGDSHAAMLWPGLSTGIAGANIMQANASTCEPFIHPVGPAGCGKLMNFIYQTYLPANPVGGLLLQMKWEPADLKGLGETIEWAHDHGIPLIVIGPTPEYDAPLPRLEAYALAWNKPGLPQEHLVKNIAALDARMSDLSQSTWHVQYVSLYRTICRVDGCIKFADEAQRVPLMADTDHLTPDGAALVVRELVDQGELRLGAKGKNGL